jgi:hypothetical protein
MLIFFIEYSQQDSFAWTGEWTNNVYKAWYFSFHFSSLTMTTTILELLFIYIFLRLKRFLLAKVLPHCCLLGSVPLEKILCPVQWDRHKIIIIKKWVKEEVKKVGKFEQGRPLKITRRRRPKNNQINQIITFFYVIIM